MTDALWNVAAYSLQLAALAAAAYAAATLFRVRLPKIALRYWQVILAAALLLPLLQPRADETTAVVFSAAASSTFLDSPREMLTGRTTSFLAGILALGIVLRLSWLALGLLRIRTLAGNATTNTVLDTTMAALQRDLGTRARILVTDELEGPATVGLRRPVVLLPRSVLDMSPAVQRAIVCHELVHVTRRDWLHTIAEEVWCAALWFHPAARLVASRLSLAREMVVDQITLTHTRDRRAYAEALLAFSDPQPHVIGVTPFIGRRTLSQRIALIAEETHMSRNHAFAGVVLALFASASLTAAVADRLPISTNAQNNTVYTPGDGVSLPHVLHEVKPGYTREAMDAKIQGSVWMTVVVGASGDVTTVEISRSLDAEYGLDAKAMEAAYKWKFKPGMKDGKAVNVRVTLEMTFTLK